MGTTEVDRVEVDTDFWGMLVIERFDAGVRTFLKSDTELSAVIERRGPRTDKRCHLGSRDAAAVSAVVNGRGFGLDIGSGKLLKRSYRITAEVDGRFLSMRPKDIETATFVNGKPHEIEKEFGELTAKSNGTVDVAWALPKKVLNQVVDPPQPTVDDVLIGYAIAAAFGTGSLSFTTIVMGFVAAAMPG
ncbi:hypothetical protein ACFWUP_01690 [Nocardia sp. NPDC058658]|uniref:hypothetical protein n=1 Tax=Nocardia sp. NPDC058658 TaxID=3346580 RepID=UPI003663ABC0